jgi:hypothetical protein
MSESELQRKSKEAQKTSFSPEQAQMDTPALHIGQSYAAAQQARINLSRLTPRDVMALQRTVGNRAVARLLGRSGPAPSPSPAPVIQAKLTVGPANDKYEQEADDVAARVLRSPDRPLNHAPAKRKDEAEPVQRVPSISRIQRRAPVGLEGGQVDSDLERSIQTAKNGGSSLSSGIRSTLESKLNADLGNVKIHTDSKAAQLNRDLGAKAFTHKNHIFYGAGQSPSNLKLTAHEAVHTIQQGAVQQKSVQTKRKNNDKDEG